MFQVHMIELGLVCGVNEYVFGRLWFEYIQGAITFATFFASSPLAPKCLDTSCRPVYSLVNFQKWYLICCCVT